MAAMLAMPRLPQPTAIFWPDETLFFMDALVNSF